jgi:hypothetical protein
MGLIYLDSIPEWVGFFLFAAASTQALRPTQTPLQWVPEGKEAGAWYDHLSPISFGVKNGFRYTFTFSLICLHGVMNNDTKEQLYIL